MADDDWLKKMRETFPDGIIHERQMMKPKLKREVCQARLEDTDEPDNEEWPDIIDVDWD